MMAFYDKLRINMAVKTEKDLSQGSRALWLKAMAAIELQNFGYAISLLQELLKQEPEFLTGRQLLRRAKVTKGKSAKKSFFNISTAPIGVMKAQREMKTDPKRAVEMLEDVLEMEPYNRQANLLLKEAAVAAGWPEIGVFALRSLLEEHPRDVKVLHELGGLYQQIAEAYARHQAEPESLDFAQRLGALNEKKEDFEAAIRWYQYAADLTKGLDTGLLRKISDLKIKCLEREIAAHEEFLSAHSPTDKLYAEKSEQLRAAKTNRAQIHIADAQERVARNPTDLQLRFELGESFFNAGRFRDAVPELQRARQNPHARLKAMNLLGCCYGELGMLDLAMKQLEEASQEIVSMDAMKKDILYNLGIVYERRNETEKSLACMKQIYEVDYGYRDVAGREIGRGTRLNSSHRCISY